MISVQRSAVWLTALTFLICGGDTACCASPKKPAKPTRAAAPSADGLDPERIRAIAAMLPERPQGVGRPIGDRAAWERFAANASRRAIVKRAEEISSQPLPDQPDDLYLDFSRTGNRSRWQNVAFNRRQRLTWLVLAECLENKDRFLSKIEE
ncbi:MAG: hypothetical protein N2689_01120, partial [Verrucomicrobiae bacterium]|nr:hypothetical protein [Verrucomicrobiae bacterium]